MANVHKGANQYEGHSFRGHIKSIQRKTSAHVNAPEYSFEFIVATAHKGIFSINSADPSKIEEFAMYLQVYDDIRTRHGKKTGEVHFTSDPDGPEGQ